MQVLRVVLFASLTSYVAAWRTGDLSARDSCCDDPCNAAPCIYDGCAVSVCRISLERHCDTDRDSHNYRDVEQDSTVVVALELSKMLEKVHNKSK